MGHIQRENHNPHAHHNHVQSGINPNALPNGPRPAREQLPDTPIKDYSNLINPRILPKDIVAAVPGEQGYGADHDTLDLSGEETFENNRARSLRLPKESVVIA